jgi:acyl-CoA synthetase (AMP-forming)/AMP-acid ligase II
MIPTCSLLTKRASVYFSSRPAIRWGTNEITYSEAWSRGLKLLAALKELGLKEQDHVATLEDNTIGAVDAYIALTAGNMVRVPLYPRNSVEAHAHMLNVTKSKVLIVDQKMASDEVLSLKKNVRTLRHILVRDGNYERWLDGFLEGEPATKVKENDRHIVRFSGGTTGLPKGIPFSHRQWLIQLRDITYVLPPIQPGDVCLHVGTLSHGSGYLFIPTWMSGGVNHLVEEFVPEKVIELIESSNTSFAFLAPSQLAALVRAPNAKKYRYEKLKAFWIAGAPISSETALLSREVFGERVYQTFSQSEIGSLGVVMPPSEWFKEYSDSRPLESAGRAAPWTELEIRSESNMPLGLGEVGEIALRADGQMLSYLGPPELTAEKIKDGWIMTGDIGYIDNNGFLYIVDRKGSMIISGGYNIWPAELERVIADIPGIREVAVVPIPDQKWGETPLAVCTIEKNSTITESTVLEECKRRLGSYKKPGKVLFQYESLPLTSVGKIDRKSLKEPFWAGITKRVQGT